MTEQTCFCGTDVPFSECCGPIISGQKAARTPEELMRSRYSAHCERNYAYLVESTHPAHQKDVSAAEIEQWASNVQWTGLEIHSAIPGSTDDEGQVSFTAHFSIGDTPQSMREDAEFSRVDGNWYYVDGHVHGPEPFQRESPKVGRNEPCPCGSGKKYKKCCGA